MDRDLLGCVVRRLTARAGDRRESASVEPRRPVPIAPAAPGEGADTWGRARMHVGAVAILVQCSECGAHVAGPELHAQPTAHVNDVPTYTVTAAPHACPGSSIVRDKDAVGRVHRIIEGTGERAYRVDHPFGADAMVFLYWWSSGHVVDPSKYSMVKADGHLVVEFSHRLLSNVHVVVLA